MKKANNQIEATKCCDGPGNLGVDVKALLSGDLSPRKEML
jgi:hypothetical protein